MSSARAPRGRFRRTRSLVSVLAALVLAACSTTAASGPAHAAARSAAPAVAIAPLPAPRPISTTAAAIRSCGWSSKNTKVHLTFDDSGSTTQVNAILDYLKAQNIRATFFPIGDWSRTTTGKALVKRMLAEGHLVGNHTKTHMSLTSGNLDTLAFRNKVRAEIAGGVKGNVKAPLLRPPYGNGAFDARIKKIATAAGYQLCYWDKDSRDWSSTITTDQIVSRVMNGKADGPVAARERALRQGDVVLFHMHGRHTLAALKKIVPKVRAKGWNFDRRT